MQNLNFQIEKIEDRFMHFAEQHRKIENCWIVPCRENDAIFLQTCIPHLQRELLKTNDVENKFRGICCVQNIITHRCKKYAEGFIRETYVSSKLMGISLGENGFWAKEWLSFVLDVLNLEFLNLIFSCSSSRMADRIK